ncbi:MAG: hypothetical protein HND55_14500 [Pseudomonadota bacterium]|nr:MAG: hypothetical protein HND55_14500 [Pseudomonadota bacterium]
MHSKSMLILIVLATLALGGCVTHVHRDQPSFHVYKQAHPGARYVVVRTRPAADRTCWKLARGWRCVVR